MDAHVHLPQSAARLVGDEREGIDLARRIVAVGTPGAEVDARLTPTEFRLLAFLAKHAGRVLTHQQRREEECKTKNREHGKPNQHDRAKGFADFVCSKLLKCK